MLRGKNFSKMNTSNYPAVVQAIHNEFNLAGEKLLQESLGIIQNAEKVDIHKASRLNSVGFVNNPLITKQKHIEEITKTPKQWAEIVMKYKKEFPQNKFITDFDIAKICDKYKLVHGDIEQYKGFVPEKNLTEIENFLKNKGLKKKFIVTKVNFPYPNSQSDGIRRVKDYLKKVNHTILAENEDSGTSFLRKEIGGQTSNGVVTLSAEYIEKTAFTICAPKADMESVSWVSKLLPNGIVFTHVNPDPIVLYPVEHGAIIVTAWGDEASDPLVINELNN